MNQMQKVGLALFASLTISSCLFAAGAKEKSAESKAARILSKQEGSVYLVRMEDGNTATVKVDETTRSNWPVQALVAGDYIEVVLDGNNHATSLDNAVLKQALGLTSYQISKSTVTKPSDLEGRFSYTYGYLLFKTLASQGLYFNVDYFIRGSLDAIALTEGKEPALFFTNEEMDAILANYQETIWSQGKAPIEYTGNHESKIEALSLLAKPEEDVDKFSYVYGYLVTYNMASQGLTVNGPYFAYGMMDAGNEENAMLSDEEMQTAFQEFQMQLSKQMSERNIAQAEAFFAQNKNEEGVITTDSGLQYLILIEGDGTHPLATDEVKFHYQLKDLDGNILQDSKTMADEAPTMAINNLVEGLVEGIPLMTTGSTWRFWLPSELAYGEFGAGDIEPDQAIQFDIELMEIVPPEAN